MTSSTRKWRRVSLLLGTLALGTFTAFGALMAWLDSTGQRDQSRSVDAIVVLGSKVNASGEASPSLRRRSLHAASLYRRGYARFVICTGGVGDNAPAESEVAARILRTQGVPPHAILTEEVSTSTWENAREAAAICRERNWKRVVVVSEPYHLWRACRNFRAFGLEAFPSPAANPSPERRLRASARECLSVLRDWLQQR